MQFADIRTDTQVPNSIGQQLDYPRACHWILISHLSISSPFDIETYMSSSEPSAARNKKMVVFYLNLLQQIKNTYTSLRL
jgi:hypothetical protein